MSCLLFRVPDFDNAFGADFSACVGGENATSQSVNAGVLTVTTGQLVAVDPYILVGDAPFTKTVPVGEFPVRLAVATLGCDQRIALARVDFKHDEVVKWEMALIPGQAADALEEGEIYGFATETGTACFMDKAASAAIKQEIKGGSDFFEEVMEELDAAYQSSWSWANMSLETANVVIFLSGYGDGYYATYYGYNQAGEMVALLTDFGVFPWSGEVIEAAED